MTDHGGKGALATPVQLMLRDVWSMGDLALIDELVEEEHVHHDPVADESIRGREPLKTLVETVRAGLPDLEKTTEELHVADGTVIGRYTATGTHEGSLLGIAPTGRSIAVDGVYVSRLADTRLVQSTDLWDVYGLLEQLDALHTTHAYGLQPGGRP